MTDAFGLERRQDGPHDGGREADSTLRMTESEVRALILALPEVSEGRHDGCATFLVMGRRFATLGWPSPVQAAFALTPAELEMLVDTAPQTVERAAGAWGRRGHGHIDFAAADEATLRRVMIRAWRRAAPRALRRAIEE